eukprot:NODE_2433_length_1065_cov_52.714286_g2415_i0.p3 GENE.NODE_2433_length_1065_cov_52.714286_g2415_i0~~NODE_2433_length_1065_cov_52.714286_g2415_i0.p3  ORF type:complete len:131 (-),score=6.45 NODE_2433_length_1065_cov_52.714286_g2415_i0:560-952(-)
MHPASKRIKGAWPQSFGIARTWCAGVGFISKALTQPAAPPHDFMDVDVEEEQRACTGARRCELLFTINWNAAVPPATPRQFFALAARKSPLLRLSSSVPSLVGSGTDAMLAHLSTQPHIRQTVYAGKSQR